MPTPHMPAADTCSSSRFPSPPPAGAPGGRGAGRLGGGPQAWPAPAAAARRERARQFVGVDVAAVFPQADREIETRGAEFMVDVGRGGGARLRRLDFQSDMI